MVFKAREATMPMTGGHSIEIPTEPFFGSALPASILTLKYPPEDQHK